MEKENEVYIHNGALFFCKEEGNYAINRKMVETGYCHVGWNMTNIIILSYVESKQKKRDMKRREILAIRRINGGY